MNITLNPQTLTNILLSLLLITLIYATHVIHTELTYITANTEDIAITNSEMLDNQYPPTNYIHQ